MLAECLLERNQRARHGPWIALAAIELDNEMEDLVDQSQRVDVARPYRRTGVGDEVAPGVHPLCKAARRGVVGEDDVAAQGKERLVEAVKITRRA